MKPKEPKRIIIEVTNDKHARVKQAAEDMGITMRVYVLRCIQREFDRQAALAKE